VRKLTGVLVSAVAIAAAGCGSDGKTSEPTGPRPNASEMFDKKEMPRGAKGKDQAG
jgi:hypothetical protein